MCFLPVESSFLICCTACKIAFAMPKHHLRYTVTELPDNSAGLILAEDYTLAQKLFKLKAKST